jgi:hypothetical protein
MLIYHKDNGICEVLKEFQYDGEPYYVIKRFNVSIILGIPVSEAEEV